MIRIALLKPVASYSLAILLALAVAAPLLAADWPQFLGPDRNGIAPDKGLARTWPQGGPKVEWTFDLGPGFGGAAVRDGEVYILDRVDDAKDVLRCLDLKTGKELWNYSYDAKGKVQYPGSRSTPTVDGGYVYTVGSFGQVYCIDRKSHQPAWNLNLIEKFGSKVPMWSMAQSPLLYKEWVIIAPQSGKAGLAALDKKTGEVKWTSAAIGGMAYASPQITTVAGKEQIVMNSTDRVVGVDPDNGQALWTYKGWKCQIPIPCATPIGDGRFFITGGYDAGCAMFKVEKKGEQFTASDVFKNAELGSQVHNALLYQNYLYANSNQTKNGLLCMDLDGNVKWKVGSGPKDMGGLVIADGLIFFMSGDNGELRLAEATPTGYKELAKAKVLTGKGGTIWAPVVLSDGKLIVRDQHQMKCLDVK